MRILTDLGQTSVSLQCGLREEGEVERPCRATFRHDNL